MVGLRRAACATHNSGDIIVQFDKMAHRWVLFQPVFSSPFAGCFAISTTPDALGTYYRYDFPQTQGFPDYPKLGIQPEAYYQSQNIFNNAGTAYLGVSPAPITASRCWRAIRPPSSVHLGQLRRHAV